MISVWGGSGVRKIDTSSNVASIMKTVIVELITVYLAVVCGFSSGAKAEVPVGATRLAQAELRSLIAKASLVSSSTSDRIAGWDVTLDQLKEAKIGEPFVTRWGVGANELLNSTASSVLDQATSYACSVSESMAQICPQANGYSDV